MAVDTHHPDYDYYLPDWTKIRDCIAGERKIHAAGEAYLPKLSTKQKDKAYSAYRDRARFLGATKRTLKGWLGSVFRKPVVASVPDTLLGHLKDINLAGAPFATFARGVVQEVLSVGRAGVLVERQETTTGRAYLVPYKAEEILNWATDIVDGAQVLSLVVLRHARKERAPDGFGTTSVVEYRVLELADGVYQQSVYRAYEEGGDLAYVETRTPVLRGAPLSFIPFVFLSSTELTPEIEESPLLDLATLNIHHYRRTADLCHGLHFTALPTPYTVGDDDTAEPIELGCGTVPNFKNPQTRFEMLEFSGAGLSAVRQDLEDLKAELAAMGAAYITPPRRDAETAEAIQLKHAEQSSPLASIAGACEEGLTLALKWLAEWEGADPEAALCRLNKDFDSTRLSAGDLTALSAALQSGSITAEVFSHLLSQAEMLPPSIGAEEYAETLREEKEARSAKAAAIAGGGKPTAVAVDVPPTGA